MEQMLVLELYGVLLVAAYCLYAFGPWFFGRYLFPVAFVVAICAGGVFDASLNAVPKFRTDGSFASLLRLIYAIVALGAAAYAGLEVRSSKGNMPWCTEVIPWIQSNIPANTTVGSFQSGYLGYFLEKHKVAALDGVVNGRALNALKANRTASYLHSEGVDYVVDWQRLLRLLLFDRSSDQMHHSLRRVTELTGGTDGLEVLVYKVGR